MKVLNTTIQNRKKQERLNSQHVVPSHYISSTKTAQFLQGLPRNVSKQQLLYSLGLSLLSSPRTKVVRSFLAEYKQPIMPINNIPHEEFDLLGATYQFLNSKRENLQSGIYYTGKEIAEDVIADLDFSGEQTILDPSCGSGSFLFRSNANPHQIIGVDADPIAIMIAKFNYFIKFPDAPEPKLYNSDFFNWFFSNRHGRFDYVIGNPPFGANLDLTRIPSLFITSGESFSYFIEFGFQLLKETGVLRYIVPQSLLNVKRHTDIRDYLLDQANLRRIKRYQAGFAGVMSDVFLIEVDKARSDSLQFETDVVNQVPKTLYRKLVNRIFVPLSLEDISLLQKIEAVKVCDLSKSTFGLGVVTGDNQSKLSKTRVRGSEPIYTGKEVERFRLTTPRNFLVFDRETLQQVAPDEIYRAPLKLVYKTICNTLRFALDSTSSLTTNSANILIPKIPGYSIYSVLAFLNSDLYSFLHIKMFGGVNKVGKENLQSLPFPKLSAEQNRAITRLCKAAIKSSCDSELQAYIHLKVFRLEEAEVSHLRNVLSKYSR